MYARFSKSLPLNHFDLIMITDLKFDPDNEGDMEDEKAVSKASNSNGFKS